jgi:hypothetical protein
MQKSAKMLKRRSCDCLVDAFASSLPSLAARYTYFSGTG